MAQLIFRCPYTNKPIRSGIELDPVSIREVGDYPISVRCPHCRIAHHGTVADGQFSLEPERSDQTASAA